MKKYFNNKNLFIFGCVFALISILSFYFFYVTKNIYHGDDLTFHLSRAEAWYMALKNGTFFNYANFYTNAQSGLVLDIFYPFLTYIPIAFLRFLFPSPITCWYLYWVIVSWLSLMISYYVGKQVFKRNDYAFIFSLFYYFSAYRIYNILIRAAVGESLAMVFYPLIILGIIKLINQEKSAWIPLSLGMTLIAYSHMLSLVLATFFLVIIAIFNLKVFLKKDTIIILFKSVTVFLLLSAALILPMLEQFLYLNIETTQYKPLLSNSTLNFFELIYVSLKNTVMSKSLGTLVITTIIAGPLFYKKLPTYARQLVIITSGTFIFMSVVDFSLLNDSFLSIIQFVWRLNAILTLLTSFIFVEILKILSSYFKYQYVVVTSFLFVILLGLISYLTIYNYFEENPYNLPVYNMENYYSHINKVTNKDYLPKEVYANTTDVINNKTVKASSEKIEYEYRNESDAIIFITDASVNGKIDTFVVYYKGFKVFKDDKITEFNISNRGTIMFDVASGKSEYKIIYQLTLVQIMGWLISIVSSLVLLISYIISKKRERGIL
ncbi:MAG: hypothetical protein ACK5KQ_03720 [Anaerorhabdus sp.]